MKKRIGVVGVLSLIMAAVQAGGEPRPAPGARGEPAAPRKPAASTPTRQPLPAILEPNAPWRRGRNQKLLALLDEHVDGLLRADPTMASRRGDERFDDQLEDVRPETIAARLAQAKDRLKRLEALDRKGFSESDALDADLLAHELKLTIDEAEFFPEQMPISAMSGPQVWLAQLADQLPIRTPKQRAAYATRLERIPEFIDQQIAQMRSGMKAGRVPPKASVLGTAEQCFALSGEDVVKSPDSSPFYKPFRALPETDADAVRAWEAIAKKVAPALRKLGTFLKDEYIPACRDTIGASESVDGRARYDLALRQHTSTALTSDEIHEIGLREVALIRAEMFRTIARTDFKPPAGLKDDALFEVFVQHLRSERRFYYWTEDELLTAYRDICKRMDAQLPAMFGRLPRLPYGVREIPLFAAKTSPTAFYYPGSMQSGVPGYFMANTYRLDQRPKYEMTALALHEAVPGHHLQIALQQEITGQHPYRQFISSTAFAEGWALYAESLGLPQAPGADPTANTEDNFYADPYDDFGRLTYRMWRACRLVVDTGVHAKGWTRQQAINYMLANTALSIHNIEREVDRYIGWPGQATAYMIGELKIRELRARAEKALGERFDLRQFHDAVLEAGAVPLPVLEARIDRWIQSMLRRSTTSKSSNARSE